MRKIIYYVATSIDGYIMGADGNMGSFTIGGSGVEKYLNDLKEFDTVIMGRKTYEFGYQYGLQPGQPAYPHMQHYIFSNTLHFENPHEKIIIKKPDLDFIKQLKKEKGTPIYLCGGGELAGWLLDNGLIDILKIKLNPLVLGNGIRLFGNSKKEYQLELIKSELFEEGLQIVEFYIRY
ncbi:MAG: dihydrofolate reductase family protein [Saprospiraceae bacterium]